MPRNPIVNFIDNQQWIGRLADVLAPAVGKAYAVAGVRGRQLKDFLNGVWLGHPLHPALTDIPVGAWTTALVFDVGSALTRNDGLERAATGSIAVGLAGALGAAVTGATDWSDTSGVSRRVGLVHGVLNLTATSFYVASIVARRRQRLWSGRLSGLLGYAIAVGSAYLGGELVYTQQIGVDHAFGQEVTEQFTAVLHERELKDGRPIRVRAGDVAVVLVRQGQRIYALADTCAHLGGPLSEGALEHGTIACPWHGSTYALEDGRVLRGPATHPQPVYECRIRGGQIEIRMPRRRQPAETERPEREDQHRAAS
jgi:nitrite reductase/ring-hydroxylating ferredoxin subunit/uncharacterized membrane protein